MEKRCAPPAYSIRAQLPTRLGKRTAEKLRGKTKREFCGQSASSKMGIS